MQNGKFWVVVKVFTLRFFLFIVTEKLWESDSTDASDNEVQLVTTEPPLKERPPSPAKKTSKKTHAEIKNKSAKQASLISFFKKS